MGPETDKSEFALQLCIEFEAITECEYHEGSYIDSMAYHDAKELMKSILKKYPEAIHSFENRSEMARYLEQEIAEVGIECDYCAEFDNS